MLQCKQCKAILICLLLSIFSAHGEGTKEIRPLSTDNGYIQIYDNNTTARPFATYAATVNERLYIHINNVGEKIYYGFSQTNSDVYYRIKDPSGNIVVAATALPTAGAGKIGTHAQAILGPSAITGGGYPAKVYTTSTTGDYYIEFNVGSGATPNAQKRVFDLFDITVGDVAGNNAIPGRVWSKAWDFTTNSGTNSFVGKMYVYSNDGVVTKIDFNGVQPYGFVVSCNSTGCANTGNAVADRQSRAGNSTYAEFRLFLNDPDVASYPSGVLGQISSTSTFSGCGPYCINVSVSAAGLIEVTINLNLIPGYQAGTSDVYIAQNVSAAGSYCISWDGKDGLGNTVASLQSLPIHIDYKCGLTHLPLYDVENHTLGYKVSSIRPSVVQPKMFWDDSLLPSGTVESAGCSLVCHSWPVANFGDNRTINTWWYANTSQEDIVGVKPPIPATVITH